MNGGKMVATKKPLSKTAKEVVYGMRHGAKLVRVDTDEVRIDFKNGDYWFLAETIITELKRAGYINELLAWNYLCKVKTL